MKRALCIALFCIMILLMGCGDYATSQSGTDIDVDSGSENYNKEQSSESFLESDTESGYNDALCESLESEENSNCSCHEESCLISDSIEDDNTTEIYSEVEIDFSEFE